MDGKNFHESIITSDNHVTCVRLSKPDVATVLPTIVLLVAKRKVCDLCFLIT